MENPDEDVEIIEVENQEIKFTGMTEKYGRAYWNIGVERGSGGVIKAMYFIPSQQPDKRNKIYVYFPVNDHVEHSVKASLDIKRSPIDRTDELSYSRTTYCGYHDLVEESFCMPSSSGKLEIKEYGVGIEVKVRRPE